MTTEFGKEVDRLRVVHRVDHRGSRTHAIGITRSARLAARKRSIAEEQTMRGQRTTSRLLAVALLFGLLISVPLASTAAPARQDEQLQIAFSVPGLNFPFFVHMMNI